MIDLHKYPVLKYPLFGSLYFSQGIIYALAILIIPIYFIDKNISMELTTAIIGILYFPWIAKFIFGGIADYLQRIGRKKIALFGGTIGAISFILLSIIDPSDYLILFVFVAFIASIGIVFLDVAADAWAIDISKEKERGKVNAAMFGGLFIGAAFTTSVIAGIAQLYGYGTAFVISGIFVFFIMIFPFFIRENITMQKHPKLGKTMLAEFRKRPTQIIALFGLVLTISFGLLSIVVPLYVKTRFDLPIGEIGLIVTGAPIATIVGCCVGGFISDKLSRKFALYIFISFNILFAATLAFVDSWELVAIVYAIIGFLHGGHIAAFGAISMDVTNPKIGATQYSILMGFGNAGEMSGTVISGSLIALAGFARLFLFSAWIYGPALLILYVFRLKKHNNKKHSGEMINE
ncbi:MFS transporter [Thermoplasmatota archaeon]